LEDIGELFGESVEPVSIDNDDSGIRGENAMDKAEKRQEVEILEHVKAG